MLVHIVTEQGVVILYRLTDVDPSEMMIISDEALFEEVWISSNYTAVFCTEEERRSYLRFVQSRKDIPRGMSIVVIKKKLNRKYTKREIMNATPEQLKAMTS
ncbi:MAG: hypothetical protein KGH89_09140 [Thaumarchaeota archaeon]|nr:hypothetical protein [Nitrososphaerota archaeon]MDE1867804.1 hypothetical protein [Nitrososphaerota archaeon]